MSDTIAIILAMGVVTFATRLLGVVLLQHVHLPARGEAVFNSLPGTILVATVAPMALGGIAEFLTALITVAVVLWTRGLTLGILAGAAAIAILRPLI